MAPNDGAEGAEPIEPSGGGSSGGGPDAAWPTSVLDILTDDVTYKGWEVETGKQKAFYVRGSTWFHTNVEDTIQNLAAHISEMQDVILTRTDWHEGFTDWATEYSIRQAYDGLQLGGRKPLLFTKAVKTIVLCEVAARHKHGDDFVRDHFYGLVATASGLRPRMRIEAAVSFIHDFNTTSLDQLKARNAQILRQLQDATAQRRTSVFTDMSNDSKTVTHRLCKQVHEYLVANYPEIDIGMVDFRLDGRRGVSPSQNEFID